MVVKSSKKNKVITKKKPIKTKIKIDTKSTPKKILRVTSMDSDNFHVLMKTLFVKNIDLFREKNSRGNKIIAVAPNGKKYTLYYKTTISS